jgi:dTMP kinase
VPIEVSLKRILNGRIALKFHEAGMDLGLSEDPKESYRLFQSQILEAYDGIASEYGLQVIEATQTIQKQQTLLRDMVKEMLKDYKPTPFLQKKENVYVA